MERTLSAQRLGRGPDSRLRRLWYLLVPAAVIVVIFALLASNSESSACDGIEWAEFRVPNATRIDSGGTSKRQRLTDKILGCNALDGKSRDWVEVKLGRGIVGTKTNRGRTEYILGRCTLERKCFFPGDTEFLRIYYAVGRVTYVERAST